MINKSMNALLDQDYEGHVLLKDSVADKDDRCNIRKEKRRITGKRLMRYIEENLIEGEFSMDTRHLKEDLNCSWEAIKERLLSLQKEGIIQIKCISGPVILRVISGKYDSNRVSTVWGDGSLAMSSLSEDIKLDIDVDLYDETDDVDLESLVDYVGNGIRDIIMKKKDLSDNINGYNEKIARYKNAMDDIRDLNSRLEMENKFLKSDNSRKRERVEVLENKVNELKRK